MPSRLQAQGGTEFTKTRGVVPGKRLADTKEPETQGQDEYLAEEGRRGLAILRNISYEVN